MFNLDNITKNNDSPSYRKLIIGSSGSGKTNYLLNSILYAKDLEETKYKFLINTQA